MPESFTLQQKRVVFDFFSLLRHGVVAGTELSPLWSPCFEKPRVGAGTAKFHSKPRQEPRWSLFCPPPWLRKCLPLSGSHSQGSFGGGGGRRKQGPFGIQKQCLPNRKARGDLRLSQEDKKTSPRRM